MNKMKMTLLTLLFLLLRESALAAITENESLEIINHVRDEFAPVAASHGAELFIDLDYSGTSIGAMATRSVNHKKWFVRIWGGVPKFPSTTRDTFTLTLCHEVGHHLGGYPFYSHDKSEWAAAEGQAEYWSTQACARRLWKREKTVNATYSNVENSGCERVFSDTEEVDLCKRIYRATEIQAELIGKISKGKTPSIKRRDNSVVKELFVAHPNAQCRVDSMLMGLLCARDFDLSLIPGRANELGQNTISSEAEARSSSCFKVDGFETGARPRCWFKEATLDRAPPQPEKSMKSLGRSGDEFISEGQLLPWIIN
jgi:hypothetical protein